MTRLLNLTAASAAAILLFAVSAPIQVNAQDRQIAVEGKEEINFKKGKRKEFPALLQAEKEAAPLADVGNIDIAANDGEKPKKKLFKLKAEPEAAPLAEAEKPGFKAKLKAEPEAAPLAEVEEPTPPKKLFKLKAEPEAAPLAEVEEQTPPKKFKLKAEPEAAPLAELPEDLGEETETLETEEVQPKKKVDTAFEVTPKKKLPLPETEKELTDEDKEEAAAADTTESHVDDVASKLTPEELAYLLKMVRNKRYHKYTDESEVEYQSHGSQSEAYDVNDSYHSSDYGPSCNKSNGYSY